MLGVARIGLALSTGALLLASGFNGPHVAAVGLLVALALGASLHVPWRRVVGLHAPLEAVAACVITLTVEPLPVVLLPYLLAPALSAGLVNGARVAVTTAGLSAAVLLVGRGAGLESIELEDYLTTVSQWTLITLAVGLLGAWVQRLQQTSTPRETAAYESAYRLISQLRLVARQLSGGLDPVSLAQHLLDVLHAQLPFDRAAVYVRSSGGRLTPIAFSRSDRLDWATDNPLFEEAWATSAPVRAPSALTVGLQGHAAVLPLRVGLRTLGLVALERTSPSFDLTQAGDIDSLLEEQSLRLETALLFSEVRMLATAEERRRLAREIHDGIAQELASMGYLVDDLAARARYLPELEQDLKDLRKELTRVISALRLSIFDLRSEVQSTVGLGTAISDYVRQVGAGSNLTVHLVLDEAPTRLPVDAETELLRITQEAVTNARKHAGAANLWVTCRVNPPAAQILVEDDGAGLAPGRHDSFGMEVMRERAARIGALLAIRDREDSGTAVEVSLGQIVPSQ